MGANLALQVSFVRLS